MINKQREETNGEGVKNKIVQLDRLITEDRGQDGVRGASCDSVLPNRTEPGIGDAMAVERGVQATREAGR